MKFKTDSLSGRELHYCVALALGKSTGKTEYYLEWFLSRLRGFISYEPSRDWSQGGVLVDLEKLTVTFHTEINKWVAATQLPSKYDQATGTYFPNGSCGDTALEAICRAYVNIKLGDVVEIPENLFDN